MAFGHHLTLVSAWLGPFLTFLVSGDPDSFGEHWSGILCPSLGICLVSAHG